MVQTAAKAPISFEEYLRLEAESEVRHELVGGELFAMSGGTLAHNLVVGNVFAALRGALPPDRCGVFVADVKLRVEATDAAFYPDVLVVCDEARRPTDTHVTDADVIVEVLSPSTEAYDRGIKLTHYTRLPGLRAYVLVDPRRRAIEVFRREVHGWRYAPLDPAAPIDLESLGVTLTWDDVYAGVSVGE